MISGIYKHRTAKITIVLFCLSWIIFSCKKKQEEIDYVYVNFDISLTDPTFVDLNAVGGWVYVTGGVKGIIIYRKTQTDFLAFERNCPYKPKDDCARVAVDASNVKAVDKCCGSEFSIVDGNVLKGPSTRPLKQYPATLSGTNLHMEN